MHRRLLGGVLGLAVPTFTMFTASLGHAQCGSPGWLPGEKPAGAGVNGEYPQVCLEWDPDGAGSLPSRLVIGGSFYSAGGRLANSIAYWDGTDWHSMSDGLRDFGLSAVSTLCVHNGQLYAGGSFRFSDSTYVNNIARWDGTSWQPLGDGTDNIVSGLVSFNGDLIACGSFESAGAISASRVARWDGTQWNAMGDGFDTGADSLAVYNGVLYAAGSMTASGNTTLHNIARWNGSAWVDVGGGTDKSIVSMCTYGGSLVVTGPFSHAGLTSAQSVAKWNGSSWQPMGTFPTPLPITGISAVGSDLVAVSAWHDLNNLILPNACRWNGTAWSTLPLVNGSPKNVTTFQSQIALAGQIYADTSGDRAGGVLRYDGSRWQNVGSNGSFYRKVQVIDTYQSGVVVAVQQDRVFERSTNGQTPDFGLDISLVRWNNGTVTDVLGTFTTHNGTPYVMDTLELNGDLYVCGQFDLVNQTPMQNIAKWNGSSWSALDTGIAASGNTVQTLASYNGQVYAGGAFLEDEGAQGNSIVRWDGSAWQPLGSGLLFSGSFGVGAGTVTAMVPYQGQLLVVGGFTNADGVPVNGIALWNGSAWSAFPVDPGLPVNSTVEAVGFYNNQPVISWDSYGANPFNPVPSAGVSLFNGTSWISLGSGLGSNNGNIGFAHRFVQVGNDLYVAGFFSTAGGSPANNIAKWNGSSWSALGDGLERVIYDNGPGAEVPAMLLHNGELLIGGSFNKAGGQGDVNFARYCLGLTPPCPADFDGNHTVNVADIFAFLRAWFAHSPSADIDGLNGVNVADIFAFLRHWFAHC